MKLPSIDQVVQGAVLTFRRFPFVILVAATATIAALVLVDRDGAEDPSVFFQILLAGLLGIPLLISFALLAERKARGSAVSLGMQILGLLLIAAYAYTVPSDLTGAPAFHFIRFALIAAALHCVVAFAAFTHTGEMNGFWQFNKTLFLRAFLSLIFSHVLYAGLALALAALDNLFGIHVPGKRYFELWVVIIGIFTTWFFLAGVPEKLETLDAWTDYPKGVKIFAQYILFPLVLVYLVILYVYLVKILITWDWPRGWVSNLIIGFSVTSIFTLLLLYPIRDDSGNIWIRRAARWFYVALLPLTTMLFFAIWRRISEYGITEGRYFVFAIGVWLVFIAGYFIISGRKSIKFIPISLGGFALLACVGPWGAFTVSENSQTARLESLLRKNAILVDGKIRKTQKAVPLQDVREISSIIGYLHEAHGYNRIQPWFAEPLKNDSTPSRYKEPSLVAGMLGIRYIQFFRRAPGEEFTISTDEYAERNIEGFDRVQNFHHGFRAHRKGDPSGEIVCRESKDADTLTVISKRNGLVSDTIHIDILHLAEALHKEFGASYTRDVLPEKMSSAMEQGALRVKVYFDRITLQMKDNRLRILRYEAQVLYKLNH